MSWSYDSTLATDRDRVRFNCGLTDTNDQIVQDEEIDGILADHGVLSASIRICRRVATKFARRADISVGDYSERFNQRAREYRQLAKDLEAEKKMAGATAIVGGTSKADKDEQKDDSDRVKPRFHRGQFDRTETQST